MSYCTIVTCDGCLNESRSDEPDHLLGWIVVNRKEGRRKFCPGCHAISTRPVSVLKKRSPGEIKAYREGMAYARKFIFEQLHKTVVDGKIIGATTLANKEEYVDAIFAAVNADVNDIEGLTDP